MAESSNTKCAGPLKTICKPQRIPVSMSSTSVPPSVTRDRRAGGSWFRSRWLLIVGASLFVCAAAVAAVPFLVPAEQFRPLVMHLLTADIQRDVHIDTLQLHVAPTVHIQATNVRIGNPAGFPPGDVIAVRTINFGVTPLALLTRKLDVTSVTAIGVRVMLRRDPAGHTNYALGVAGPPGPFSLGRVRAITLRDVAISLADIDLRGRTTPVLAMGGVNATARSIDPGARDWAKRLEFVADLRGAALTMPALAAPVRFQTGRFQVRNGAGQAAFATSFETLRATGTVKIPSFAPLSMTFSIVIPELNLETIGRAFHGGAGRPAGAGTAPVPSQSHFLARGMVTIDRLVAPPWEATRASARLSIGATMARLDSFVFPVYGGTIQGAAALNYSAAGLPAAASMKLRGINLERVIAAASPRTKKITGTLEADLNLATTLRAGPTAALRGGGTFAVRDGAFPGMDLKGTMIRIANALQYHVPAGDTRFRYFGGDLDATRQRVYSRDLQLHGSDLEAAGHGSFGFDGTLDYTGTATVPVVASTAPRPRGIFPAIGNAVGKAVRGVMGPTEVRAAFSVGGTFSKPTFAPVGSPGLHRTPSASPGAAAPQAAPQQRLPESTK